MDLGDALLVVIFGAMAFGSLAVSLRSTDRDRRDCIMLSLILIAAWAMSNIAWLFLNPLHVNSVTDVTTLAYCLFVLKPFEGWRQAFVLTVALQIAVDIYREIATTDFTFWAVVLNASFGLQTVIVALGALPDVRTSLLALPRRHRDPV